MNHNPITQKRLTTAPRQQQLDFMQCERWRELPRAYQQACCQALAQLLHQVILETSRDTDNEREDPNTPS
jgi:hypothetical protein